MVTKQIINSIKVTITGVNKFPEKRPSSKYFSIYWAAWPLSRLFNFTAIAQKQDYTIQQKTEHNNWTSYSETLFTKQKVNFGCSFLTL